MNAKEYLQHVAELRRYMFEAKRDFDAVRSRALSPATPNITEISAHDHSDRMADNMAKQEQAALRYARAVDTYFDEYLAVLKLLEPIALTDEGYILQQRYIDDKPLKIIARELELSYEHTRRKHGHALQIFAEIYKEHQNQAI